MSEAALYTQIRGIASAGKEMRLDDHPNIEGLHGVVCELPDIEIDSSEDWLREMAGVVGLIIVKAVFVPKGENSQAYSGEHIQLHVGLSWPAQNDPRLDNKDRYTISSRHIVLENPFVTKDSSAVQQRRPWEAGQVSRSDFQGDPRLPAYTSDFQRELNNDLNNPNRATEIRADLLSRWLAAIQAVQVRYSIARALSARPRERLDPDVLAAIAGLVQSESSKLTSTNG